MDFGFNDQQQRFRTELADWLAENLPDGWLEGEQRLPTDETERFEFRREWTKTLYEDDWTGIHWSEEYGGRGASLVEQTIYREELARTNAPRRVGGIGTSFVGPTLVEVGTEHQRQRFLDSILSGEEVWCQGYSEPGAGSDVAGLTTRAERDGDRWLLNGQKIWTSGAHHADWCFLVARTDSSGTKHEGLTTFLVDMDQPGITTERIHMASDEYRFDQVYFDDAVTDEEMIVGEVGDGWRVVMNLSAFEHASTRIFRLESQYRDIFEYCRSETRNGRPLVQRPEIRRELADLDARIQAAKAAYYRSVSKRSQTGSPGSEGSMDLLLSDEIRVDLLDFAMRIRGPDGARWDDPYPGGDWVTDHLASYGSWIARGTGDIQRNIIGERVLGLPKDDKDKHSHRRD